MKALILKDFRAYRTLFMLQIIIMLLYSYLNIRLGSVDGIVGFLVVILPAIVGVILFLGDQELITYMASMPVSRKELVICKYVSTYLFGLIMVIITICICWFLSGNYPKAKIDFEALISLKGFIFAITPITFIVSIIYPILFKFGLMIGVKIILACFAVLYGLGSIAGERLVRLWLSVPRRGIFAAAMALMTKGETVMGYMYFYSIFIAVLVILIIGSISLSVYSFRQKNLN